MIAGDSVDAANKISKAHGTIGIEISEIKPLSLEQIGVRKSFAE